MTMNSDIAALIERVEKAETADRELDAFLWLSEPQQSDCTFVAFSKDSRPWREFGVTDVTNPDSWVSGLIFRKGGRPQCFSMGLPPYTASIDAAVALIKRALPGATISLFIGHLTSAKDGSGSRAQIQRGKGPKCPSTGIRWPRIEGECFHAPTPALALILALLRALQCQEPR